jgi:protein-S-isoprenylcysteine O-methyltransferase Ste14
MASDGRKMHSRTAKVLGGNLLGAAFAAYLLWPNLEFFLRTHAPMAAVFVLQQVWVGAIFLIRRAPRSASHHPLDWVAAYGGWLTGLLVRPGAGYALPFAPALGLPMQCLDLAIWTWAFANLARSYGIVPADRGLVTSGPYRFVRHPLYASYMVGGLGYILQSLSLRNVVVLAVVIGFQLTRIVREERHLAGPAYDAYRSRVRWRLLPHIW